MDFRLKVSFQDAIYVRQKCFNPCSNGLSAQRVSRRQAELLAKFVSILVLMDFRLKVSVFPILASVEAEFQSLF